MPTSALTDFDRAAINSLFFLGHEPDHPERPIPYPRQASQRPHLAYYGATRSGKTFAIEYALQQIARNRRAGFCFIDPHGSGYWRMASYLRQRGISERVIFWDINDSEYVVTYDPFAHPDQSPAYIAGNLSTALLSTMGRQAAASDQPHLKTMMDSGLLSLLELGLPFAVSHHLFDPNETIIKQAIAARLERSGMLGAIAELPRLLDRYHELAAPFRRIDNLFRDDRFRCTFTTLGLNFRQLMDEGWIVLVNTEPKDQDDESATLFTRLLVKSFFMAARQRPKADSTPPFFLVMDEASRYLTSDTAAILAQTAGYGLYLLAGMQSLEQARLEDEASYVALRTNVGGEVVMRLLDHDEKMFFTRRFFGDHLDFSRVKHRQKHTVAIPRVVDHVTHTTSQSRTKGGSGDDVTSESETETPGQHIEYDYEELDTLVFYTPDELERLEARRFSQRPEGQGQRLGIARVNQYAPTEIEIPKLPPAMYAQDEMAEWLRTFKETQPATLPLPEARQRFDALVGEQVKLLLASSTSPSDTSDDYVEPPQPTRKKRRY